MRKKLRILAKWYLQRTCNHKFVEIELSYQDGYALDKCKKCKLKKYSDL